MNFGIIMYFIGTLAGVYGMVPAKYDIRAHYDKPYCEEKKVGKETIKKCYEVKEIK